MPVDAIKGFKDDFPKISFADAQQDGDIIFDERTFKYFART
jgi:hypothetical protein